MPTIETYRNKLLKLWKKNPENREIENWLIEYDREMEKEELDMVYIDALKHLADQLIQEEEFNELEKPAELEPVEQYLNDELKLDEKNEKEIKEKVNENKEQIKLKKAVETIQKAILQLEAAGKIPKDSVFVRSYMRKKYVPKQTLMPPKKNTTKEKQKPPQQNQEINPIVEEEEEVPLVNRRNSELTEQQKEWAALIYGNLGPTQQKKYTLKEIENLAVDVKSKSELLKKVNLLKNKKKS
jgi:hypothetical protein